MSIATQIDGFFRDALQNVSSYADQLASAVIPLVVTGMIIFVVVKGFMIIKGMIDDPIMDLVYLLIKWSIILMFIKNASGIASLLIDGIPTLIGQAVSGSSDVVGLIGGIEAKIGEITEMIDIYFKEQADAVGSGIGSIGAQIKIEINKALVSFIFSICSIILLLLVIIPYLLVSLIFTILALVAPLYISFLMFDVTKGYFQPWISLVITNSVLLLLISFFVVMLCDFISNSLLRIDEQALSIGGILGVMTGGIGIAVMVIIIMAKFWDKLAQASSSVVNSAAGKAAMAAGSMGARAGGAVQETAASSAQALSGSGNITFSSGGRSSSSGSGGRVVHSLSQTVIERERPSGASENKK